MRLGMQLGGEITGPTRISARSFKDSGDLEHFRFSQMCFRASQETYSELSPVSLLFLYIAHLKWGKSPDCSMLRENQALTRGQICRDQSILSSLGCISGSC